ncbi:hypothetical protein AB0O47_39425, partial [Streptomyces noursei]|uniref:hypothetical protein n=1 Tax=Streptomyces noursei TaxID=1971 RepID=UPI00344B22B4
RTPQDEGIDPARQWWATTTHRPHYGDAIATVTAPGSEDFAHLLTVILPAADLDAAEDVAHYAIKITRQLVTLTADLDDAEALATLRELLGPDGPHGPHSQLEWDKNHDLAWDKIHDWIARVRVSARLNHPEGFCPPLDL